ncbi:MAG: hypothetical protein Q8M57_01835 [Nitrosomonas sp.]|uniref:hypothetical protein n=1 Tax=Nitrosomonas sp. TaxID=42353 RepID=UPI002736E408|nr:hypothetical protein [Nitrosomonas sp.]MDP3279792.1 hypothetical protein [Nitrosomonas sp.]
MDVSEIYPKEGHIQHLYCDECGGYLDLTFHQFDENVSGVHIRINGLPYLSCEKCDIHYLPDDSRFAIIYLHEQATKKKSDVVNVTRNKTNVDSEFTHVPFIYDSDDYKYIPGLKRPFDVGFLTPVYFNREVLLKYDSSPTYRLSFASTTYGEIRRSDDFSIPFGVNKNGNVIMWLGDIARLPEAEQYYLRSENIEPDHSIGSEFYDGQIEAKFTDHSKENILFQKRSMFLEECFKRFGVKAAHLDKEVYDLAISFNAPIVDTEKERRHVADTLNKIHLESFDNNALGQILNSFSIDPKKFGSIKRLQLVMEQIANPDDVSNIISPFYVLYDLRVAYSHLGSKEGNEGKLQFVKERLGVAADAGLLEIYNVLVGKLGDSYDKFTSFVKENT